MNIPAPLVLLFKTIFFYLLMFVVVLGVLCILASIITSFIDSTEARRKIIKIGQTIVIALSVSFVIVILVQLFIPIVDPVGNFDKLLNPSIYTNGKKP